MYVMTGLFYEPPKEEMREVPDNGTQLGRVSSTSSTRTEMGHKRLGNDMRMNCCRLTLWNIQIILNKKHLCCCLKVDKKNEMIVKSFKRAEKEIQVTELIKQIRVLKGIAIQGKEPNFWQQAYQNYRLKPLEIKSESD